MDRIAVILRGHLRVWDLIKEINFEFFDSLPYPVDFYIATWSYEPKKIKRLRQDFKDRNVEEFSMFQRSDSIYNPWVGPAKMATELTKKRIHNQYYNDINYKFIIETRFDVALFKTKDVAEPDMFEFGSTETSGQFNPNLDYNVPGLGDHCFLSGIGAHQIMNTRLLHDPGEEGNHIGMYKFAKMHGVHPFQIEWFQGLIARPNIVSLKYKRNFVSEKWKLEEEWQKMSKEQKINMCTRAGCDPTEYAEDYHIGKLNAAN